MSKKCHMRTNMWWAKDVENFGQVIKGVNG